MVQEVVAALDVLHRGGAGRTPERGLATSYYYNGWYFSDGSQVVQNALLGCTHHAVEDDGLSTGRLLEHSYQPNNRTSQ